MATDSTSRSVSTREVLCQVWNDFTDKEVQAGYTYTYIWMANQVGHFTLGFLPTILASWLFRWFGCEPVDEGHSPPLLWFALVSAAFWGVKEIRDVVRAKRGAAGHVFPVNVWDLWRNAGTAVYFFWTGILVAVLGLFSGLLGLIVFVLLSAVAVLVPARYWLPRRLCFQRAHLPRVARLADFTGQLSARPRRLSARNIESFLEAAKANRVDVPCHLLVFGEVGTGRTYLAVAIGTEHSFEVRRVRYLTWTKLLESAVSDPTSGVQDGALVWPWMSVDILILDDMVDQSGTVGPELLEEKRKELRDLPDPARNALRKQRVVWVFGSIEDGMPAPEEWIGLLRRELNMEPGRFGCIELEAPRQPRPKVTVAAVSGL